jgi:hypothetical protein
MRGVTISKINEEGQIHEKWKENLGATYEVSWKNPKLRNSPAKVHSKIPLRGNDYDLKCA